MDIDFSQGVHASASEPWEFLDEYRTVPAEGVLLEDLQRYYKTTEPLYITHENYSWGTCSWCDGENEYIIVSTGLPKEIEGPYASDVEVPGEIGRFDSLPELIAAITP